MNANKQDADGLPELPEPVGHVHSDYEYCAERPFKNDGWPVSVYEAHQVRDYGELCRAAPAGGDPICPECKAPGLLFECVACSHSNYPKASAPAGSGEVSPPKWYTREEIVSALRLMNYSDLIAQELADWFVRHLQHAFNKGHRIGQRDAALLRKLQQGADAPKES